MLYLSKEEVLVLSKKYGFTCVFERVEDALLHAVRSKKEEALLLGPHFELYPTIVSPCGSTNLKELFVVAAKYDLKGTFKLAQDYVRQSLSRVNSLKVVSPTENVNNEAGRDLTGLVDQLQEEQCETYAQSLARDLVHGLQVLRI